MGGGGWATVLEKQNVLLYFLACEINYPNLKILYFKYPQKPSYEFEIAMEQTMVRTDILTTNVAPKI